jgi:hypothetical protein
MVAEVLLAAVPRAHVELGPPDHEHHEILDEIVALEVLAVDEVVLELVEDRDRQADEQHRRPPRQVPREVAPRERGDHREAPHEARRADRVLVREPAVLGPQALLLGHDGTVDRLDAASRVGGGVFHRRIIA